MNTPEIEKQIAHRPWNLPETPWKYYQEWNNAILLHWKADFELLRKLVPQELEIDVIDGNAWVSLVAFTMEKIRPRYLPYLPNISNFDEINIRTYIKSNSKSGVYFLSIEGAKALSCTLARRISELPYRYSQMHRTENTYGSTNHEFGDSFSLSFKIGNRILQNSDLDNWLMERYALFQDAGDYINAFDIHHAPWEINSLEVNHLELNYKRFGNLLNGPPDKTEYSKGVQVIAWDRIKSKRWDE